MRTTAWLVVACLLLLAGCAKPPTVLVRSQLVYSGGEAAPEVTATPRFRELAPQLRGVAVRAPDYCSSRAAAATTGGATGTGTVLATRCGVEMGELEKALVAAGYRVASWMQLANMVETQRMTPRDAAQQLGADVLFQINSLQEVSAPPAGAGWQRELLEMDSKARDVQGPYDADARDRATLFSMVARHEARLGPRPRVGASLDLSAVHVATGESIWFYRWSRLEPPTSAPTIELVVREYDHRWEEEGFRVVGGGGGGSPYFALVRDLVADFVRRFRAAGA